MITDTHCHLYEESFDDLKDVIERAQGNRVHRFIIPNVDIDSIEPIRCLLQNHAFCYGAMGLHPTYVKDDYLNQLTQIKRELDRGNYIAVGEVGIDLYWSKEHVEAQKEAFRVQIEWSIERELPLIIHCREAFEEVFAAMKPFKGRVQGVFHSFTGGQQEAETIINEFGFMIGINGVVTYKNSQLREVLKEIPLSKLILETDSPYLSPVPHRGQRNEPSNIGLIASYLSSIYKIDQNRFEEQIEMNVLSVFGL